MSILFRCLLIALTSGVISASEVVLDDYSVGGQIENVDDFIIGKVLHEVLSPKDWSEKKIQGYAHYPLARMLPDGECPVDNASIYKLLKQSDRPIIIGNRQVKAQVVIGGKASNTVRFVYWLEPRPKYLNDEELKAAIRRGEFSKFFPKLPIGEYDSINGTSIRVGPQGMDRNQINLALDLSINGVAVDVSPISCALQISDKNTDSLIGEEIDRCLLAIGNGFDNDLKLLDVNGSHIVSKGYGQFGHTGYWWPSHQKSVLLTILGDEPRVLEAFIAQLPSDLPANLHITRENAGLMTLRRGLEKLRQAPPVIEDDRFMIRIRPWQNQDCFFQGLQELSPIKDLWDVTYGHEKERKQLQELYISTEANDWNWQAYIDAVAGLRAKTLAAVESYVSIAEKHDLVYVPHVSREPWEMWVKGKLPPCYALGVENR